jgi:hypothetical protein
MFFPSAFLVELLQFVDYFNSTAFAAVVAKVLAAFGCFFARLFCCAAVP